MKQFKYNFLIFGGPSGLHVGMEGPNGLRVARRIPWLDVVDAKLDVIEVSLEILEQKIDDHVAGKQ